MDIATLIGLILGVGAVVVSIPIAGVSIMAFVDVPSMMIVGGGILAALLINFPLKDVLAILKIVPVTFQAKEYDPIPIINRMIEMTNQGVRRGNAVLEAMAAEIPDSFMRRGIELVASAIPDDQIRYAMETELEFTQQRHTLGESFFMAVAAYGPAYGMIGTLIGLVAMLQGLGGEGGSAVAAISSGMAVALITTFYGSMVANLIGLPFAGKLRTTNEAEYAYRRLIIEGVILVSQGIRESAAPKIMGERLGMYLPPARRAEVQTGTSSAA